MRARPALAGAVLLGLLVACGPPVEREAPAEARRLTDDLARTVLAAVAAGLAIDPTEIDAKGDARRCGDDADLARQQVDDTLRKVVPDPRTAAEAVVDALGADVDARIEPDGTDVLVRGTDGPRSFVVTIGADEQLVSVRSECQDLGPVQAVEVSFDSRYRVRLDD